MPAKTEEAPSGPPPSLSRIPNIERLNSGTSFTFSTSSLNKHAIRVQLPSAPDGKDGDLTRAL
jgi:hypothetical protein